MPTFNNFSVNKKRNSFAKIVVVGFLLIAIVIVLNFFGPGIKNLFFKISSPLQKTSWSAGASSSGFFASLIKAGSLRKENESLKDQNQKLISEIVSLQALNSAVQVQDNAYLACNPNFELLMAGVIGLDGQDIISINKGSEDGILEGMPVINQQNVLFGRVDKVYKNFSHVMLISNKKSVVSVRIELQSKSAPAQEENPSDENAQKEPALSPKEINGVIKGSGNLGFYLDLVPVDSEFNKDDIIVTSSLEKVFPKDLLIGKVLDITKNDQKPFLQAKIKPFFDLTNTDNLFVVTNYKTPK